MLTECFELSKKCTLFLISNFDSSKIWEYSEQKINKDTLALEFSKLNIYNGP